MNPIVISIIIFVAVSAMVAAAAFAFSDFGNTKAEDRLDVLAGLKTPELSARGLLREDVIQEGVQGLSGALARVTARMGNMRNLFIQADSPISVNVFAGISAGFALLGTVGAIIARTPLPLYPPIAIIFGSLPLMWLVLRRRSRFKKFGKQLPDGRDIHWRRGCTWWSRKCRLRLPASSPMSMRRKTWGFRSSRPCAKCSNACPTWT